MSKTISYHLLFFILFFSFFKINPAFSLCVKVKKANLRQKPGKNYRLTWVVGKYMPLIELEWQGAWTRVEDVDQQIHWVHNRLLSSDLECVVTNKKRVLLYTGPGKKFSLAEFRQVDKYTPFKRIRSKKNWYYVEDEFGQKFWVHKNDVWRPLKIVPINF